VLGVLVCVGCVWGLWDSIYSNWDKNPWVWVIEFEVIKSNIDKVIANEH